jgi:hypothetical protein
MMLGNPTYLTNTAAICSHCCARSGGPGARGRGSAVCGRRETFCCFSSSVRGIHHVTQSLFFVRDGTGVCCWIKKSMTVTVRDYGARRTES